MRIAPLIIATSLATLLAFNLSLAGLARAATMDPRSVTMMLAKSQALDAHCKLLSESESQDLRDLVARAEIALAGKYSVAVARETLARGRADGKAAACDSQATTEVREILRAGMMATAPTTPAILEPKTGQSAAAVPGVTTQPEPQSEQRLTSAEPSVTAITPKPVMAKKVDVAEKPAVAVTTKKKQSAPKMQVSTRATTKVKAEKKVSLAKYSSLAQKYYVELKCHTMPLSRAQRMYENVLAQHRAAMASEGADAVRRMLKNAQSRAGSQNCA